MFVKAAKRLAIAAALLALSQGLDAGIMRGRTIGTAEGLPNPPVTSICQDEYGFIWMGTRDGLARYDGTRMTVFRPVPGDATSIFNNNVKSLCPDGNGHLYIICKYALSRFDMKTGRFETIRDSEIQAISCKDGEMWAATSDSVFKVEGDSLRLALDTGGSAGRITEIIVQDNGTLWFGSDCGLFRTRIGSHSFEKMLDGVFVRALLEDSSGSIWVGTRTKGLYCFSPEGEIHIEGKAEGTTGNYVRCICESATGRILVGTISGLYETDPADGNHTAAVPPSRQSGIASSDILCLMRDASGNIWAGTDAGAEILPNEKSGYTFLDGLYSDSRTAVIDDVAEDKSSGTLYFATEESGIMCMDQSSCKTWQEPWNGRLGSENVMSILLDDNRHVLWAGTRLGGLNEIDLDNGKVRIHRNLPHDHVIRLLTWDGKIIAGTGKGVALLDPADDSWQELNSHPLFKGKYTMALFLGRDGNLWTGVSGGLLRHNMLTGEETAFFTEGGQPLANNNITCIFEDTGGRLWLGTSGSGILLHEKAGDSFHVFNPQNSPLGNGYIYAITESAEGSLLILNNDGFVSLDARTGAFSTIGIRDEFPLSSFIKNGLFVTSRGQIIALGHRQAVMFKDTELPRNNSPENIYFTDLEVNGSPTVPGPGNGILQSTLLFQKRIVLKGRVTSIGVNVAIPDYLHKKEMEYRLLPGEKKWNRSPDTEQIRYTNLKPGRYTLQARCPNGTGHAHKQLEISVLPPWYGSIWAWMAYILMAALAIYLLARTMSRTTSLKTSLEQERREKKMMESLLGEFVRGKNGTDNPTPEAEEETGSAAPDRPGDYFLRTFQKLLRDNLSNGEIIIEDLASEMAMSRAIFFEKVKAATGTTPNKYMNTFRLQEAARLLVERQDLTVNEICFACGFNTPSYFIKKFRVYSGCTPLEYRKKKTAEP